MERVQPAAELREAVDRGPCARQGHAAADEEPREAADRERRHRRGACGAADGAQRAAPRERAEFPDPLVVELVVEPPQERRQVERPQLLRLVAAEHQLLQVVALPVVRRHAEVEVVRVARVQARHVGERRVADQDEREQQRLQRCERCDDADGGHERADEPEQPVHGLQRAELALHSRALDLVVELGVLEVEQVGGGRHVEHAVECAPADELAEQPALLVLDRPGEVERDGQPDDRPEPREDVPEVVRVQDRLEHLAGEQQLGAHRHGRQELDRRGDQELPAPRLPDERERALQQPRQLLPGALGALGPHHLLPGAGRALQPAFRHVSSCNGSAPSNASRRRLTSSPPA